MAKRLRQETTRLDEAKTPPDGVKRCRTCQYSHLCCYEMSGLKDPVIAKCTIKQYNNYDVANSPRKCDYYIYDSRWHEKKVEMRRKSTGWRGWCSVNKR